MGSFSQAERWTQRQSERAPRRLDQRHHRGGLHALCLEDLVHAQAYADNREAGHKASAGGSGRSSAALYGDDLQSFTHTILCCPQAQSERPWLREAQHQWPTPTLRSWNHR